MQTRRNSEPFANALELRLVCIKPSTYGVVIIVTVNVFSNLPLTLKRLGHFFSKRNLII